MISYISVVQLANLIEDIKDKEVTLTQIADRLGEIKGNKSLLQTCERLAFELKERDG